MQDSGCPSSKEKRIYNKWKVGKKLPSEMKKNRLQQQFPLKNNPIHDGHYGR